MKRMTRRLASTILVVLAIWLSACGSTPVPAIPVQEGVANAIARAVTEQLGLAPGAITLKDLQPVNWRDACLGAAAADEMCAQAVTPGYSGFAMVGDLQYEVHASQDGSQVRLIPGAALSARQVLAQQLRAGLADVQFAGIERVEWPDACLGAPHPGEVCAQMITPGYKVMLAAAGQRYEMHTDATGGTVRLAAAPTPEVPDAAITWRFESGGLCQTATFGPEAIAFGPCDGVQMSGKYAVPDRAASLGRWLQTYASFEASTVAGQVRLAGQGTVVASPAERRMVAEWAKLAAMEADAGRSGASYGLALSWHREGGIAGFCDDLSISLAGDVYASSCRGAGPKDLGHGQLNADQLQQLYDWVDRLQLFEMNQTDPATADAMSIHLLLSGTGAAAASEAEQQAIQEWAAGLFASLSQ
jgi:hypothetical protein